MKQENLIQKFQILARRMGHGDRVVVDSLSKIQNIFSGKLLQQLVSLALVTLQKHGFPRLITKSGTVATFH